MDTLELFNYLITRDSQNVAGEKARDIIDYTLVYIEQSGQKKIRVKDIYNSAIKSIGSKKKFSYVYFINVLKTRWELEKVNNTLILDTDNEIGDLCYIF